MILIGPATKVIRNIPDDLAEASNRAIEYYLQLSENWPAEDRSIVQAHIMAQLAETMTIILFELPLSSMSR